MPTYTQNTGADLLPDGVYPFYVRNAKLTTSTNLNEKIELVLQVNGTFTVYDNLTFVENSYWKIDQFRIATGEVLGAPGSKADFEAEDCIQRRGLVEIGTNEFPAGSGRKRNQVVAYIDAKDKRAVEAARASHAAAGNPPVASAAVSGNAAAKPEPDDIPF